MLILLYLTLESFKVAKFSNNRYNILDKRKRRTNFENFWRKSEFSFFNFEALEMLEKADANFEEIVRKPHGLFRNFLKFLAAGHFDTQKRIPYLRWWFEANLTSGKF